MVSFPSLGMYKLNLVRIRHIRLQSQSNCNYIFAGMRLYSDWRFIGIRALTAAWYRRTLRIRSSAQGLRNYHARAHAGYMPMKSPGLC